VKGEGEKKRHDGGAGVGILYLTRKGREREREERANTMIRRGHRIGGGQARVRLQGRNSVPEVFLFFVSPLGFPWMDPLVVNGSVCAWSHPKEPEEGLWSAVPAAH